MSRECKRGVELNFANEIVRYDFPIVMGIVNLSEDSFYNPISRLEDAMALAEKMIAEGADILDIGAVATSPNTQLDNKKNLTYAEIKKIIPVVEAVKKKFKIRISIDTSNPEVMQAAIDAGADMINDQRALQIKNAADIVIQNKVPVCLMHWILPRRVPGSSSPEMLLKKIKMELKARTEYLTVQGLPKNKIVIDPGFGQGHYGKNLEENFYILEHLSELQELGFPVLAGWSRKSMIGDVLGVSPEGRLYGSITAAVLAAQNGASILRVHDVGPTKDALKIAFYKASTA